MSSLPKLPQEVIDQIIDHVALSGDWLGENLLHCALVNRSVHYRSQQYIFTSIVIRGHARRCVKKIRGLLAIIHRNPDIAHYIEELTLEYIVSSMNNTNVDLGYQCCQLVMDKIRTERLRSSVDDTIALSKSINDFFL